ncbi:MAG: MFS transporter [Actinomycetota bacterium]|nr:MFS transporter [Actinomycetota bacterium]
MSLLRHRDFRLLWAGQSVSDLGTAVSTLVLPLVAVVTLKASAFEVGVLSALEWLPWLLVGLPAGAWVDRLRARPILISTDLVRLVSIVSVPVAAAFGGLTIGLLFVAAFVTGFATVLFQVAYQAYLPRLVDHLDLAEGNAKLQGSQAVAAVVGPGLGGLLVHVARAPFALFADAASYLVSLLSLLAIRTPERTPDAPHTRGLRAEIAEGARYVRADPLLRVLTIAPAIANFFFIGVQAIIVLFLVRQVHVAPGTVGVLVALVGLGAVIGAVVARRVGLLIGTSRALWLVSALCAPFALLIPLTTRGAGLVLFILGNVIPLAGVLVYNVTIGTFRQAYCPPAILGRVVASMRFVLFGTMPLGALLAGALASALGPRTAMWVLTAGTLLPALVLTASPLRALRDLPPSAAPAA